MSTITVLALILLLAMTLVGGKRGALAFTSLILNFGILFLTLVLVAYEFPPVLITLISGTIILAFTIFLGDDDVLATQTAFVASLLILVILLLLIIPVEHWSWVQGFGSEDSEDLEGMSLLVGVSFVQVASVTAVLSTLGAIAEAAMAISAGLAEIIRQHPKIAPTRLFQAGISIGKQIIGTTFNTLFFGFFGGFLDLFIWFVDLKYSLGQLLNDKIFGEELLMVLFSLISVILTVPISAWVMSQRLKYRQKHHQEGA